PNSPDPMDQATGTVVVSAPKGEKLSDPQNMQKVEKLVTDLRDVPQAGSPKQFANPVIAATGGQQQYQKAAQAQGMPDPVATDHAAAASPLSDDGRIGLIQWTFDADSITDVEPATQDAVHDVVDDARDSGLKVEVTGSGMQGMPDMGVTSELIGVAVALLVLVLTFGSLVAAGLPILTALVGVGIGTLGVTAATAFVDLGTTTPILATMLG